MMVYDAQQCSSWTVLADAAPGNMLTATPGVAVSRRKPPHNTNPGGTRVTDGVRVGGRTRLDSTASQLASRMFPIFVPLSVILEYILAYVAALGWRGGGGRGKHVVHPLSAGSPIPEPGFLRLRPSRQGSGEFGSVVSRLGSRAVHRRLRDSRQEEAAVPSLLGGETR